MGQRSGVGLVELAILEALGARRAWPGRRAAPCRKVLAALEDELGLARGYAYQVLIDLAQPWQLPVPLVEGQGNFGGRGNDPPASPYYTEARLSPAGRVAMAAERGEIAPVPIGLINGNTHRQGTRPPFRPAAVIEAIRKVLARPRLPGRKITALMGPPDFITGCTVTGDLAALAAGQRTELGLHARITVTDAADVKARVTKAAVPGHTPPHYTRDPGNLTGPRAAKRASDNVRFLADHRGSVSVGPGGGERAAASRNRVLQIRVVGGRTAGSCCERCARPGQAGAAAV